MPQQLQRCAVGVVDVGIGVLLGAADHRLRQFIAPVGELLGQARDTAFAHAVAGALALRVVAQGNGRTMPDVGINSLQLCHCCSGSPSTPEESIIRMSS